MFEKHYDPPGAKYQKVKYIQGSIKLLINVKKLNASEQKLSFQSHLSS